MKRISVTQGGRVIILLLILATMAVIVFFPSLRNGITNWDDPKYVTKNELIKKINAENITKFFTVPVSSNFHPLTLMSLAIDYQAGGGDPFYFHLHNLILHILNILLVFLFIFLLGERKLIVAFLAALIFGIHPMHVESVAWISERKDVLYTFFFLAGLIMYLFYDEKRGLLRYLAVLLLFVLSGFAKSAAVVFPLCLLLIDLYRDRKQVLRKLAEKIPFFLISLVIGIIAFRTQEHAIYAIDRFNMVERLAFASYGFTIYLVKFFFPYGLSALHLFPAAVPGLYFALIPVMAIVVCGSAWALLTDRIKPAAFGILFYTITVILVLQIVAIGNAIIAERYTYVPYIGIAFIVSYYFERIISDPGTSKALKYLVAAIVAGFLVAFSAVSFERTGAWMNSETLWEDALKKDKENYIAYNNLGVYYQTKDMDFNKSLPWFTKAVEIRPTYTDGLRNRAFNYFTLKRYNEALDDFNALLRLSPDDTLALRYRALSLAYTGQAGEGLSAINTLMGSSGNDIRLIYSRGLVYSQKGQHTEALADFRKVAGMDPDYENRVWLNIGICCYNLKQYDEALKNLDLYISKDPKNAEAFRVRAQVYRITNERDKAIMDFAKAIELDPKDKDSYQNLYYEYFMKKDYRNVKDICNRLISVDSSFAKAYYDRSVANFYLKDYKSALSDALKARELGFNVSEGYINSLR